MTGLVLEPQMQPYERLGKPYQNLLQQLINFSYNRTNL